MRAGELHLVGPDNGLLSIVAARAQQASVWEIVWRPAAISRSFHGRDLFAPIAARLAAGDFPRDALRAAPGLEVTFDAGELAQIVYVDHYGNAMTGIRGARLAESAILEANGERIPHAGVFAEVAEGEPFWYVNSIDLIEIACNRASAAARLRLRTGMPVAILRA